MNERIRELIEKATRHYPATDSSGEFSTFDKEKFAQLIVDEVYDYILKATFDDDESWPDRKDVKKHFGVEE